MHVAVVISQAMLGSVSKTLQHRVDWPHTTEL